MKKALLAVAVLGLVILGVWGFRKAKDALLRPVELIEGDVAACHVVFGADIKSDAKDTEKRQSELTKTLKDAGITPEAGMAMWIREGRAMRTGMMVRTEDFKKARALKGDTLAVAFPAQRGWVAAEMPAGKIAAAMAMGRFFGSAMTKAQALGWTSYCVLVRMDGEPTRPALVRAPK